MSEKVEHWEEKYGKRREEGKVTFYTPPERIAQIKKMIQDQFFQGQQAMFRKQIEKEQKERGGI